MALSHRWELGDIQTTAESLLVRTITLGTYHECEFYSNVIQATLVDRATIHAVREHAEAIEATFLLQKIDEFENENAFVLGELM